jgi:prophage antirepressor-like protein
MTNLTEKETAMIVAFIREGAECNGATEAEHVLDDNMTWMSATDLCKVLGWNKQEVGGVMSSLQEKRMINDSGESSRGAQDNDWYASDKAITEFFHLV